MQLPPSKGSINGPPERAQCSANGCDVSVCRFTDSEQQRLFQAIGCYVTMYSSSSSISSAPEQAGDSPALGLVEDALKMPFTGTAVSCRHRMLVSLVHAADEVLSSLVGTAGKAALQPPPPRPAWDSTATHGLQAQCLIVPTLCCRAVCCAPCCTSLPLPHCSVHHGAEKVDAQVAGEAERAGGCCCC